MCVIIIIIIIVVVVVAAAAVIIIIIIIIIMNINISGTGRLQEAQRARPPPSLSSPRLPRVIITVATTTYYHY